MKKENIKYWVGGFVVVLIGVIIYFYMKYQNLKDLQNTPADKKVVDPTGQTPGSVTVAVPPLVAHSTNKANWRIGDPLFCTSGIVNVYESQSASASNIAHTFSAAATAFATVKFVDPASAYVQVNYLFLNNFGLPLTKVGYIIPSSNITN